MGKATRHTAPTAAGVTPRHSDVLLPNDDVLVGGDLTIRGDLRIVGSADEDLHGGGQLLFKADVGANFVTASTSFVDLTGANSGTFTIPDGPFAIEAQVPLTIEEANQGAEAQILVVTAGTLIAWTFVPKQSAAGQIFTCQFKAVMPSLMWAPTPGTTATVKVVLKTTAATSDVTVFVTFGAPLNTCQLVGYTLGG